MANDAQMQKVMDEFIVVRNGLRKLRGGIDMVLLDGVPDYHGFESKESKDLKAMRKLVNASISQLDRFEDMSSYHKEFEKLTGKLIELTGGEDGDIG